MLLVATSLLSLEMILFPSKLPQKYVYRNANSHHFKHQRGRKTSLPALTCNTGKKKREQHYKKRPVPVYYPGWCWSGTLFPLWSLTQQVPKTPNKYLMASPLEILPNNPCRFSLQTVFFFQDLYCLFWSPWLFSCPSYAKPLLLHVTHLCILPGWRTRSLDPIPHGFCVSVQFFALSCSNKNFPVCTKTKVHSSASLIFYKGNRL